MGRASSDAVVESIGPDSDASSLEAAPWPVFERKLLTKREQSFYRLLLDLYPDHKILVQVALSQLIDVPRDRRDRQAIRGRFKQLVADFVLCRADLSVVAVIELDDSSHAASKRQYADARKTKALQDAGIRLVRIPAGPIPTLYELQTVLSEGPSVDDDLREDLADLEFPRVSPSGIFIEDTIENLAATFEMPTVLPQEPVEGALAPILGKLLLGVIPIIAGWIVYSQLLAVSAPSRPDVEAPPKPLHISSMTPFPQRPTQPTEPAIPSSVAAQAIAEANRADMQAAAAVQQAAKSVERQRALAWSAFYSPATACEHPVDWNAQVECGNQFIRAKKAFEKDWQAQGHTSALATEAQISIR